MTLITFAHITKQYHAESTLKSIVLAISQPRYTFMLVNMPMNSLNFWVVGQLTINSSSVRRKTIV